MAKRGSQEWKNKISQSNLGRLSPKYWFGKKHTQEYKNKMSKSLSGNKNPRYGVKLSDKLKKKISQSVIEYYKKNGTDYLKGKRPQTSIALQGHSVSDSTKRKISQLASQRQIREKNPNWRGGITPVNLAIRESIEYEEWRNFCMERDSYTCIECGRIGGQLEVDHIKPFSLYPELRFDPNNGRTLCKPCHRKIGWSLFREDNPRKRRQIL